MTIGIYGLGRFGSFWARILSESWDVCAASRDPSRPAPPGVRRVSEGELFSLPVIVLCVAISALEEVIDRFGTVLSPGTLVMDTCSVKLFPIRLMERKLPAGISILGTHPMFGPDSALHGISGLPMILCPSRVSAGELEQWESRFKSLGLSVHVMNAEDHDREAAFTQGVAHYIGRVLKDFGVKESPIATVGFTKLLEIVEQTCNDPWQLFLDLQRFNPFTTEMRSALKRSLDSIMGAIDSSLDMPKSGGYDGRHRGK
jgi:prephenate dehydrogenase